MKFKHQLLIMLLACIMHAPASLYSALPDSLQKMLSTASDSTRVELLLEITMLNMRSLPDMASNLLEQAVELSEQLVDSVLMSKSYSLSGVMLKNKGDFANALEFHIKSLSINEKMGNKRALATNYNDIGIIYKTMHEYDNALNYYRLSNALCIELEFNNGIVMTLSNMGTIYEAQDRFDDAIIYYNRAYEKAVEFENFNGQAITLNNLGDIYANMGDSYKARDSFKKALEIDKQTGDMFGHLYSLLNVGATFIGTRDFDSASTYYNRAESLAKELGSAQHLMHVYAGKTKLYEEMGDYRNAYRNLQIQKSHQDTVYNETRSQQLAEAEKRFEADKKDQEIMLLRQEQMIKDMEIDQHRAERTALISAMILAAFILIYLYNRHKQRQKAEVNKQLLRQKQFHLKSIVETQEQERKRIAKDLHDGVGQTLSGVKLKMDSLISKADSIPEKEVVKLKDLVEHIDEACTEVRSISHQMMPKVLQEDGLIPAIGDMLEKTFRNTNIEFVYEHYGISSRLEENVEVGLYRICQELVNNIIKHSGANKVNVQLIKNTGMLVLLVEDNGRGMSNGNSKSKGIGLMNINSRVETINGEFNLEPSPISGTLATIRIPIKWQKL